MDPTPSKRPTIHRRRRALCGVEAETQESQGYLLSWDAILASEEEGSAAAWLDLLTDSVPPSDRVARSLGPVWDKPRLWRIPARPTLMHRYARAGFSLIEIMVVIMIIGLMAALVGPRLFQRADEAKIKQTKAQIGALKTTLGLYRLDVGRFPTTEQGLEALKKKPAGIENWSGPYIDEAIPHDAWNRPFEYRSPGSEGREFELLSGGADGHAGGTGIDADIVSWDLR